jgi:hypothetical protein
MKFSQKMAILPIFIASKRPMGRNGAVRFLHRSDGIILNIAEKKN